MAECHTCGKTVDREAKICNSCGRPNPTTMRKAEGCSSVLGIILVVFVLLAMWAYMQYAPTLNSSSVLQTEPPPAEQSQQLSQPIPSTDDRPYIVESDAVENSDPDISSSPKTDEIATSSLPDNQSLEFSYSAHLVDSRGQVVIQSDASMLSKNVTSVAAGTHVQASSKDGKWISVRLDDGQVGFVRQKQLQFE